MEEEEADLLFDCVDCGATIDPERDRAFAVSPELYLCFDCSIRRGGRWDAYDDKWVVAPNVGDEPDERRAHP